jgi:hypothetical protein
MQPNSYVPLFCVLVDRNCCLHFFFLYVGVAVCRAPQDGLWVVLLFGFGLFFFVGWGVAAVFSCHMLHRKRGMWMWQHVSTAFFSTTHAGSKPRLIKKKQGLKRKKWADLGCHDAVMF